MDGLFTVFGLGTAFGVFCSWMYDVIRKRNLPVNRGASFEAFHGDNVLPAPEPLAPARSAEPVLKREPDVAMTQVETKPGVAGYTAEVKSEAKPAVSLGTSDAFASTGLPTRFEPFEPKAAETSFSASDVPATALHTTDALDDKPLPVVRKEADLMPELVGPKAKDSADLPVPEVIFEPEATLPLTKTDFTFEVQPVDFVDTVAFEPFQPTDVELPMPVASETPSTSFAASEVSGTSEASETFAPSLPSAPRVVLLVNNTLVREVQEDDLAGLMREFGIMADSEQAQLFQSGNVVTIGRTNVQLAQV